MWFGVQPSTHRAVTVAVGHDASEWEPEDNVVEVDTSLQHDLFGFSSVREP